MSSLCSHGCPYLCVLAHCSNECPSKAIKSENCKCWCNTGNPKKPVEEWDGVSECKGGDDDNGK